MKVSVVRHLSAVVLAVSTESKVSKAQEASVNNNNVRFGNTSDASYEVTTIGALASLLRKRTTLMHGLKAEEPTIRMRQIHAVTAIYRKALKILIPNGCRLATDKKFSMGISNFDDSRLGGYCCGHIFRRERPALLVVREGGDWQFLCGGSDHDDPLEPYHVSVGVLLDVDPTLHQIADLPPEWEAERTEVGANWLRTMGT